MYYVFGKNSGQILVLALIFLSVILITTLSIFSLVAFYTRNATIGYFSEQALHLAEAGVDYAIHKLNTQGSSFTGESNVILGSGTFTVTISDIAFGIKEITSTGYISSSQNPKAHKTVKVRVSAGTQVIAFRYAVQVGEGGLVMNSNATINGNAYSNGNIVGTSNSKINGDAYAVTGISSPDPTVTGTKKSDATPQPMPEFDPAYWKDKADDGEIRGTWELNGSCDSNLKKGPMKIEGDLIMNSNTCLTLTGVIWVTGNFEMNSNTDLYLDSASVSTGTVIIVDGKIQLNSNAEVHPTTSAPKGYVLLASTKESAAPEDPAIELNSNAVGGVYYALSGPAQLNSNANLVAITAYKLIMNSNAVLNYDSGLDSAQFSSGPGGGWEISSGTYKLE